MVATCRSPSKELEDLGVQVVSGVDVASADGCQKIAEEVKEPLDVLINNAGYFYEPVEKIDSLNFEEVR